MIGSPGIVSDTVFELNSLFRITPGVVTKRKKKFVKELNAEQKTHKPQILAPPIFLRVTCLHWVKDKKNKLFFLEGNWTTLC